MKIKIGIIGFGRMGHMYAEHMRNNPQWDLAYICDTDPERREKARSSWPETTKITDNEDDIFNDPQVQVVGLFTLANDRAGQIKKAVELNKHIIAEKPIADNSDDEWNSVKLVESYPEFSTVNLYLRNSWYHHAIKQFIAEGEIGELAILRICHMTPGLAPGEGHEHEGPAFHDCGMHYVDIARWYAESEYKTWNAQGIRLWDYKDPWWLQCHGTFENGIVFDITQGFVYGQLSKDQTHNSYIDVIGTKGTARMTHDFKTAVVELRGVTRTERIERPYGGKNLDLLCSLMADSITKGRRNPQMPKLRDAAIASELARKFLEDSMKHDLPSIGDAKTLEAIIERRKNMKEGYGLLRPAP